MKNEFRSQIGMTLAERSAMLAAVAATGRTFDRSLMERNLAGQAVATGLTGALSYGLLVTSQSMIWAGVSLLAPWSLPAEPGFDTWGVLREHRRAARALAYGTYLTGYATSRPLQRLTKQKPGESRTRSVVRSALRGAQSASALGLLTTATSDALYTALHQVSAGPRTHRVAGNVLMLSLGGALATALVHEGRRRQARATGQPTPGLDPRTLAVGLGTAATLSALGHAEGMAARRIGDLHPDWIPHSAATAIGHTLLLAGLGAAIGRGVQLVYSNTEKAGSALEPLQAKPPDDAHVSGGPASSVPWETLTREGRRFSGLALSSTEIREVMGAADAKPCRIFVPLGETEDPDEQAQIAVQEMDAFGAFERSLIVLCSPTGTGYVNYVMAESVEYLTRGDCAIVSTQYSLRPSFLSLDRVRLGRHNARALFNAVHDRVQRLPADKRPRVVQFGESLGAHTGQDVMMHRGSAAFHELSIERALFIGTPEESKWAKEWRADPAGTDPQGLVVEVSSFDEWLALPEDRRSRARIVLLSHHADPITKFGPELAVRQPDWLDPDPAKRPPGIPAEMTWHPMSTFFMTAADVINAMSVIPGQFKAVGHDYREDLARFVSVVFDLPATSDEMARIERALRRRELLVAESRLVAEQISAARARAEETLSQWGVDPSETEALIGEEILRDAGRKQ